MNSEAMASVKVVDLADIVQSANLADFYRNQNTNLENEVRRLKDELDQTKTELGKARAEKPVASEAFKKAYSAACEVYNTSHTLVVDNDGGFPPISGTIYTRVRNGFFDLIEAIKKEVSV